MNGTDLLAEFRRTGSDEAFRGLVRSFTNLVFSVANRHLGNASLAEEATQMVFVRLAPAAERIRGEGELVAWLHRTAVHVSIDLWRSETRRRIREQHAVAMQPDQTEDAAWEEIAPVLDEALDELADDDRQVLLLRFFHQKRMRDLGAVFGVSEDAAKMRVSRALERLRGRLSARGVGCGAGSLATLITDRSVEAAPATVIAALMCLSIPAPTGIGTSAGLIGFLHHLSRTKLSTGLAVAVLVGVSAFLLLRPQRSADRSAVGHAAQAQASIAATGTMSNETNLQASAPAAKAGEPDPLKLLLAVGESRQRIASGSMDLQITVINAAFGPVVTNRHQINALFDGPNRRFEDFVREYAYVGVGAEGEASREKMEQQGLTREAAVQAGLLEGFDAHYVTAWDGEALFQYRESIYDSGRRQGDTTIDDPGKSSAFCIDPRCLGLYPWTSHSDTLEKWGDFCRQAKSLKLTGKESVEGREAWHVQMQTKYDDALEFWIDLQQPGRVLKVVRQRDAVVSQYNPASPADSLPTVVQQTSHYSGGKGERFLETRIIRSNAQFNVPINSVSWTLAGLGMPVGTSVVDVRAHRSLGYWTGIGLSEWPPPKAKTTQIQTPPNPAELRSILENNPASREGLEAAAWILLNTPDGPDVEKAAEVLLSDHIRNPDLAYLAQELRRVRHRCSRRLLEAMIQDNPSAEVRVNACFTLATLLKDESKHGANKKATAEAEKFFERVIAEAGQAGPKAVDLVRQARPELYELRTLIIGKPAPATEGEDLDGQTVKLSDYRGKVVVVSFWTASTASDEAEHRRLVERLAGKSFALIGVNCDEKPARADAAADKNGITWPSFRDGRDGPISTKWNVRGWLSVFVLDRNGVIRYRDPRGRELDAAVDALLVE